MTKTSLGDIAEGMVAQDYSGFGLVGHGRGDENDLFQASLTRTQHCKVEGSEISDAVENIMLIDKSKLFKNETKRCLTPRNENGEKTDRFIEKPTTKEDVPLLQRLRVVDAESRKTRPCTPKKPLPQEVFVASFGSEDGDGVLPAVTAFSELGVDGMASARTLERRTPMKFTFDGVVPSQSSLDEIDVPPDDVMLARSNSSPIIDVPPAFFPGLEYEAEDGSLGYESLDREDEALPVAAPVGGAGEDTRNRERCISISEASIEFSESQHFRNCEQLVADSYKIFSPRNDWDGSPGKQEKPIDHGFDVIIKSPLGPKKEEKQESAIPWIDFSFFQLW